MLTALAVDRSSPIPLWFQVAQHFEQSIAAGTLPQGSLLDNEIVLAERLGISRPTMRRAMEQLVDQGLVVRRRGIGTRVVQPKVRRPLELTSLHDDLSTTGQEPTTVVLRFETVGADARSPAGSGSRRATRSSCIERLRSALEQPIARMTNWLPADVVTFEEDAAGGDRPLRPAPPLGRAPALGDPDRRRPHRDRGRGPRARRAARRARC